MFINMERLVLKKFLVILLCFCTINAAYALSDAAKGKLKVTKQIYSAKRKALNNKEENIKKEYVRISESTTLSSDTKAKKLKSLESQLENVNREKDRLKREYKQNKKVIKNSY